jgi:hypothetical protein
VSRRRLVRLDRLVLGANPEKLKSQSATPAAAGGPLSDKERVRLQELTDKLVFAGPLTHEEKFERERLRARAVDNRKETR